MPTIEDTLHELAALQPLAPEHRAELASCARNRVFHADEWIMREGEDAGAFYVIREGAVALETAVPGRGAVVLQTLHDGELLGWSWLVPPYKTAFDARSLGTTHAIELDGACLRGKCEADPALGYDLMKLISAVFVERLQDTRLRLLDLYGKVGND
jgi:CRP/FNR family transcriptional regulator, cyclic AMP receptor protein